MKKNVTSGDDDKNTEQVLNPGEVAEKRRRGRDSDCEEGGSKMFCDDGERGRQRRKKDTNAQRCLSRPTDCFGRTFRLCESCGITVMARLPSPYGDIALLSLG
jgi:hypothetical protein